MIPRGWRMLSMSSASLAGRTRTSVRDRQARHQDHSALLGLRQLHHQGRPHREGGQYHLHRQPGRQLARSARGDEESAADRDPALDLPGEPLRRAPTTPANSRKIPSGFAALCKTEAISAAEVDDPITHIRNEGGLSFFTFRPRKGKRIDIRIPVEEGDALPPWRHHLHRQPGTCRTSRRCALSSPRKTVRFSMPPPSARDWTICARLTARWATSTSPPCPPRAWTTPSTWSISTSTSTRASLSTSRASSSQGNTITRDRVIRRELLLEEGQVYNSNLWESSLLRLNQLDYFDPLKVDQDSELHHGRRERHRLTAAESAREGQELDWA